MGITLNGIGTTNARNLAVSDQITLGEGSGERRIYIDGGNANRGMVIMNDGSWRWQIVADATEEDYEIHRYNDSGVWQGQSFMIDRTDGRIYIKEMMIGDAAASVSTLALECDTSGVDDLEFWADSDISATLRLNSNDDLVWRRYQPKGTYQDDGLTLDSSTGDIFTDTWQDYSGSSTIVGWSSTTIEDIRYKKLGELIHVQYVIEGTSNSTSTTFTLPYSKSTDESNIHLIRAKNDGGAWVAGLGVLGNASSQVVFYTSPNGGGWASSNAKGIQGQFFYQAS